MRKPEIMRTLSDAKELPWLQCLIALAWIFGKRINEILRLRQDDIWTDEKFLYVRFFVSKKKSRRSTPIPERYVKRITLKHLGVPYILSYIDTIQDGYLFPDPTQKEKIIRTYNKQYEKWYEYKIEGGHVSRHRAKYLLKKINPKAWLHLFRESLATEMAEHGATEEKLMHWFDWDDPRTAHRYVKRGTKLTEELSERTW